jgi:hypothetical protein
MGPLADFFGVRGMLDLGSVGGLEGTIRKNGTARLGPGGSLGLDEWTIRFILGRRAGEAQPSRHQGSLDLSNPSFAVSHQGDEDPAKTV